MRVFFDAHAKSVDRERSRFWSAIMSVIGLVVMAITPLVGVSPANAAGNYLSIDKEVDNSDLVPGQSFTYTITVRCSEEDCINAQVRDPLPSELAGFAIQNVTFNPGPIPKDVTWLPGGTATPPAKVGADTVLVVDLKQATDGGNIGLQYGQDYRITISLQVPADYPPGSSGDITNVASATADNANRVEDDAVVRIESAVVMGLEVDKTWLPANQSFNPGADSTIGLSARNTSNVAVESLMVQEPKAAPAGAATLDPSNPFTITDFTGFDAVNLPAACTTVRVDAYVLSGGTWGWVQGTPAAAPAVALPAGVSNGDVGGVRITCLGTIPPGQSLNFELDVEQRATHRNTAADLSTAAHSVDNVTTGQATLTGQPPANDDGDASYAIAPAIPTVEAAKDISPGTITAGQSALATLGATNGGVPVSELRLADLNFFTSEVTFGGFDTAPVWPAGATAAQLTYHLAGGTTQVATLVDGVIPAAPSGRITGFEIVWTGDTIQPNETGSVKFAIDTTENATGPSSTITLTNTVDAEVTAPNGLTDDDQASDELRIINPEIAVTLAKSVRPSTAVNPGESVIASLQAHATVLGAGTELTDIVVEDVWDNGATGFWNAFDFTSIAPTQVPPNTRLTVEVWDGTAWHQLALQAPSGSATVFTMDADALTTKLSSLGLNADAVKGLRFSFNNTAGFPTDTNVTPNIEFEARSTLRDGSGPVTPAADQPVNYVNSATVDADGESAGGKPLHDDDGDTGTGTVVTEPGGPGPGVSIEKTWVEVAVDAQSNQSARTHLDFNVSKGMSPVVIADQPGAPSAAGVAGTVFDAFNLTAIEAIAPNNVAYSTGWYLLYDSVTKVELHNGTGWQEVTAPGGSWMTAVRGFKGYSLTAAEQTSTIAVRITLAETAADTAARQAARQPGAALDPYAPAPNVGVGYGSADRRFTLGWQIRDKARSDGRFVTADATYNHVDEGTVVNTVGITGTRIVGGATATDTDSDTIVILDPDPLVTIDKTVNPTTSLFTPPVGTPAANYPTATWSMTAKNASTAKATYVRLTDPATCTDTALGTCQTSAAPESGAYTGVVPGAVDNPFDISANYLTDPAVGSPFNRFDATDITIAASVANQVDLTKTTVWLLRYAAGAYSTEKSTATAVDAMTAAQLADVVGFSVAFQGSDPSQGGTITQSNDLTVTVASRLRATLRVEGTDQVLRAGQTLDVTNRAFAQSYDPVTSPNVVTGDADDAISRLTGGLVNIAPTKTITPAQLNEPQRGNTVNVTIGANQGSNPRSTLSPQRVVIEDQADSVDFWNNFDFTGLGTVTLPSGADRVRVDLYDGTSWVNGTAAATPALPSGVALRDVQGIRLTFTRADGALFSNSVPAANWAASAAFTVVARDTLRDSGDPLDFAGQRIDNTQTSSSTRTDGNNSGEVDASDDIVLSKGTQEIAVNKLTNEGNRLNNVGSAVPFDLTIKNVGTGYLTVTELTDDLPAELVYLDDPAPIYAAEADGTLSEDVTATVSADGAKVTFTWPEGGRRMLPNETFKIRVFLELQPGLSLGQTALNTMTVRTEEVLTGCRNVQNGGTVTSAWNADKTTCGTTDYVGVVNGPNLFTAKGIRGSLPGAYIPGKPDAVCLPRMTATPGDAVATDGRFYRPQCVANSQVGGTDDWVLNNVNSGTTAITDMIIFDQLPVAGDQLLVSGATRGSEFRPRLVADSLKVTAPAGTTQVVEVTSSPNVCRDTWTNIRNQNPCEQAGEVWETVTPDTDWATVSGFRVKLTFAGTASGNLAPGQKVDINYSTINELADDVDASGASRVVPAADQLAYNQHGIKYRFTGQAQWRELAPSKVGVHLRTGAIGIEKTVTGPAKAYAPTEFLADVSCRIDDAVLDLGADAVIELNAAGNYEARIDGIPLSVAGTQCTVAEKGTTGMFGETSRTGSPTTLLVDEEVAPGDDLDAAAIVSLGNDYQFTSLSVQKLVDTAAVDTTFGPFSFELSCLSILGETVTFADDATELEFDLAAGDTWTSPTDRIPVGAECTLTETDNYLADQIVIVGDNVVDEGDGVAKVTPGVDPAEVVVTNGFDAGTVTINKVVDGAGAARWGTAAFGFDVTCTYQEQTPFDGSFTLRAGDSKTLGPYPAGTECTVQEVRTGGATASVLDPADGVVTVASPVAPETISQATVTATNTFALTSLDVVKERVGVLAAKGANGPFEVALSCTWLVDGKRVGFEVPGGAERKLTKRNNYRASYNNLPSSSQCVLKETEDGGAKRTTISGEVAGKAVKSKKATIALDLSATTGPGEASVTVTNEFEADVSDGGDENENGALNEGENNLPGVGSPVTMWLLATGGLLLLGGAVLLIARRRGNGAGSA